GGAPPHRDRREGLGKRACREGELNDYSNIEGTPLSVSGLISGLAFRIRAHVFHRRSAPSSPAGAAAAASSERVIAEREMGEAPWRGPARPVFRRALCPRPWHDSALLPSRV